MKTIHAVYENGVFQPKEPVDLPERTEVEFEPKVVGDTAAQDQAMQEIYEILSLRFDTGERDVAARHNEHQP
jgi:predicted DNA-binding antitoxin AbrB/MazE fold protein